MAVDILPHSDVLEIFRTLQFLGGLDLDASFNLGLVLPITCQMGIILS